MSAYLSRIVHAAEERATVRLRVHPQYADEHNKSPDFIVDAEIRIPLFPHLPVIVKVPLLVEVEAGAGFSGGLADLQRFIARSKAGVDPLGARIELPFVIATESASGNERDIEAELPVRFVVKEIPIPER